MRLQEGVDIVVEGKTLKTIGYEIVWNKPLGEGTIDDPRMPVCCESVALNGGQFEIVGDVVLIAAEAKTHNALKLFHATKSLSDG